MKQLDSLQINIIAIEAYIGYAEKNNRNNSIIINSEETFFSEVTQIVDPHSEICPKPEQKISGWNQIIQGEDLEDKDWK